MRVDGVCAVRSTKKLGEKLHPWSAELMFLFSFLIAALPHSFSILHLSVRVQADCCQTLSRQPVDAIRRSFPTTCNRLRLVLRSTFFFSLFVNAFLLFPSLIFNLLRHGPYCCFRVAQGYGVTVLLSLRLPSFLPFFTLARLRSQSNLHIANHVKCLRMSN